MAIREHFANLAYLTGFDPRFEEAVLILGSDSQTLLLVVGNECESYVGVSPSIQRRQVEQRAFSAILLAESAARPEPNNKGDICRGRDRRQPRRWDAPDGSISPSSELSDAQHAIELPSYLVDTLARTCRKKPCRELHGFADASGIWPAYLLLSLRHRLFRVHQRTGVRECRNG